MPYLKLKIVSGSEIGQNDNYSFTHQGGSIGRSEDCDWTLLDSDRFISKKHLAISYRNQQFILTDLSSNGVVVNNSSAPLGRGNEHRLQITDSLVIGKHVIRVEDINVDAENVNPFQAQSSDNDLLGLVLGTDTALEPIHEPIPEPQPLFNAPQNLELPTDSHQDSGLGLGDILSTPVTSPAENEFSDLNNQSNPFDISTPSAIQTGNTVSQDAINPNDSLIPDDWDMFNTAPKENNFEPAVVPQDLSTQSVTEEHFGLKQEVNAFVQSETTTRAPDLPPESPSFDEQPLDIARNTPHETKVTPTLVTADTQIKSVIAPHVAPAQEVSNTTDDDFFNSLYEKLGLSKEFKATINRENLADDIATILLSTTQGLMSLLASRTAFKQESRLSSTLIQPRSNNPIKFSIDPVDTLEMLLVKKKKGYMSVGDSYDEAMEDIQLHQMAFMSGLQGTLDGVLAQLDPEDIEQQVSKNSQRFMGLNSNSQCWKIYKEKQPLLAKSVKENLNEVLGSHFSDAYQAQINSFKNDK